MNTQSGYKNQVPSQSALDQRILRLIQRGSKAPVDEQEFNTLALDLFRYQFAHNLPYRRYAKRRGQTPPQVQTWQEIPAVPTGAFKEAVLTCFSRQQARKIFKTSGTTTQKAGRHYLDTLTLYEASIVAGFQTYLVPDGAHLPMFILTPSPEEWPHSSLSHMMSVVKRVYGAPGSRFFITQGRLASPELVAALNQAVQDEQAVFLLGTALAWIKVLDHCRALGKRFALPPGSRIMETGGFKGCTREIAKEELYRQMSHCFEIPLSHIVNEYGMTEMGTQFYDGVLYHALKGECCLGTGGLRCKVPPPWARTRVIDPETGQEVKQGEVGLLQHLDLVNRGSVCAILTSDLGRRRETGFEILGRAPGAEARGCSIAIDTLLQER